MSVGSLQRRLRSWRRWGEAELAARLPAARVFGPAWVHPGHFAAAGILQDGLNINGPSLVQVPPWVSRRVHPEARYYLYFAHHLGRYLRMAWAPALEGPWTLHNCGSFRDPRWTGRGVFDLDGLRNEDLNMQDGLRIGSDHARRPLHVASPDVHLDPEARRWVMYAHMPVLGAEMDQMSFAFTSEDGLWFEPMRTTGPGAHWVGLGPAYMRIFEFEGRRYAVSPGSWLHRAPEPGWAAHTPWQRGPQLLPVPLGAPKRPDGAVRLGAVARHLSTHVDTTQGRLTLYFTRVGDAPEQILAAEVELRRPWEEWRAGPIRAVHRARARWEGAAHEARASAGGVAAGGVNQLRDPCCFVHSDGRRTLLYTVQGERAIAGRTLG